MRLTPRDRQLVRDISLSHVLSRDQIIDLGYFSSITRANTRLRQLREMHFLRGLSTPFFDQFLYTSGPRAKELVGEQVASLLSHRSSTPRFIQHALCTTNLRIELINRGATGWRFEQQIRHCFRFAGRDYEVRPDGMVCLDGAVVLLEVDRGHVNPQKFREKLLAYDAFVLSRQSSRQLGAESFKLLTVTTGSLRCKRLLRLCGATLAFCFEAVSAEALGVTFPGEWS